MEIARDILEYFAGWTKLKIRLHVAEKTGVYFYERDVWWASLGANVGFEQDGKNNNYERPILILKKFNEHILWAIPLTSKIKENKYYFITEHKGQKSCLILSQLRLISSKRLLRRIRRLPKKEFTEVKQKIKGLI